MFLFGATCAAASSGACAAAATARQATATIHSVSTGSPPW